MATLHTRVILSKNIKMDRDYKNVLDYTETNLLNLCRATGNLVAETTTAQFINPTGEIRVPFTYSQCLQSNYIAFQNPDYDNKWFFGFIDGVTFKAEKCQIIQYTIDVWSTWFKKLTIKPSFVIREHVNNDTIGLHTVDEGLDIGEAICLDEEKRIESNSFYVAMMTTYDAINYEGEEGSRVRTGKDFTGISLFNSNFFGNLVFLFPINLTSSATIEASVEPIIAVIMYTLADKSGDLSCITNMFIVPDELIDTNKLILRTFLDQSEVQRICYELGYYGGADKKDVYIAMGDYTPTGFYVPFNNKCYCYPYNYLYVTNNSGNENIYRFEDFERIEVSQQNVCAFEIDGAISPRL